MTQEPLVDEIYNFPRNIGEKLHQPLLTLDAHLRVRPANRAGYQTFHVSPEETERRHEPGDGGWDNHELRTPIQDIAPESSVSDGFELESERTFPGIGRWVMKPTPTSSRRAARRAADSGHEGRDAA